MFDCTKWKAISGMLMLSLIIFLFTGCGLFGPEPVSEPIDPPQSTEVEDDSITVTTQDEEMIMSEQVLYLADANGYVVPVTMQIPYKESIATQVLTYMVKGGPVEELLPTGFQAILPKGTKLSISIQDDGLAVVDFSKEFLNYDPEDEAKILDAVTWALTEFPTIERVKIWVNGYALDTMPKAGTPVDQPLTRAHGINLELADGARPGETSAVTLYFEAETPTGDYHYYVPVTRLIPRTEDLASSAVKELVKGPEHGSGLVTSILPSTQVLKVVVDNGVAVADFDDTLLGFNKIGMPSDSGLQSVVLSLAATTGAKKVQIMVNGEAAVFTETMDYSKPVNAPKQINTYQF